MKYRTLSTMVAAAMCAAALAACNIDNAAKLTLADSTVTNDVAVSTGDAMATHVETMVGNETSGSFAGLMAGDPIPMSLATSVNRTTTCYDVNGVAVTNCLPLASVRKIVSHAIVGGTRARTDTINTRVRSFTGAFHRIVDDTTTRVFTGATETSRVHNGRATAHDTTLFTEGEASRAATEAAVDSVRGVAWAVPRGAYPTAGYIVRIDTANIVLTKGTQTVSRSVVRTAKVTFPPDAQGNVALTINGKTCTLNLVTHKVSACI